LTEIYLEDGKTHKQTDHILVGRRWHSSKLDIRFSSGAECNTEHYLVVTNVRERLAVSKQAAQMFNVELSELEFRKQYQIENSNWFAALENSSDDKDINRAWENI
jgi:hypothetical protein